MIALNKNTVTRIKKEKWTQWILIVIIVVASQIPTLGQSETNVIPSSEEIVWHWVALEKPDRIIHLEIYVDEKLVAKTTFPVKQLKRSDILSSARQRIFEYQFTLKPRKNRWFRGVQKGLIIGNLWEAGGDRDGITLGVSWVAGGKIILHNLYFASVNKRQSCVLDCGVGIKSY